MAGSRRGIPAPWWSLAGRAAALLLVICLFQQTASAQGGSWADDPDWIPSLSFRFDTFDYQTQSSVVNLVNPPAQEGSLDKTDRELLLLGDAELLGPVLSEELPGRPRLFASAGGQFEPFSADEIFSVGNQQADTELAIARFQTLLAADIRRGCLNQNPPTCATAEPGDFEGQGSQIEADFQPSWFAAVGVAFSFPVAESLLLQVKPSIAYNADRIDFSGTMKTVTENDPSTWPNPNIPQYTVHRSDANGSTTDHSIGPGIEVALALFRSARPLRASLYADARFLWLISGRTTEFSDSVGSYEVRRDAFGIRAGAGVRLSWMGYD